MPAGARICTSAQHVLEPSRRELAACAHALADEWSGRASAGACASAGVTGVEGGEGGKRHCAEDAVNVRGVGVHHHEELGACMSDRMSDRGLA